MPTLWPITTGTIDRVAFASVPRPSAGAVPRFAGEPLLWVRVSGTSVEINAFTNATVRLFVGVGASGDLEPQWSLWEVAAVPTWDPGVFLQLAGGLPTQYVLLPGLAAAAPETFVRGGSPIAATGTSTDARGWFALTYQDRIMRDPATWAFELNAALGPATDAAWASFAGRVAAAMGTPAVRVLDHVGRPAANAQVEVTSGGSTTTATVTASGDTAVAASGTIEVAWPAAKNPIIAGAEKPGGAFERAYTLAAGERHAQIFDADAWFGTPPSGSKLARWRPNSNYEPLIDGGPYFEKLAGDLRSAKGGGAYFAGFAFQLNRAEDNLPWTLIRGQDSTRFVPFLQGLSANGTEVQVLVNKLLQVERDRLSNILGTILPALAFRFVPINPLRSPTADLSNIGLFVALMVHLEDITRRGFVLLDLIAEFNDEILRDLGPIAHSSRYPATTEDNPLVNGVLKLGGSVAITDLTRFGVYHQKFVVVRPPGGPLIAYVGGIDISNEWNDTPLHRSTLPVHDVQVRLTGPAAADAAITFRERYVHEVSPAIGLDENPAAPDQGTHLVQIARTYFAPKSAPSPLPYAVNGERLIFDTTLKAIEQARDFIYIEDQAFTPSKKLVEALVAAGEPGRGVRALVLTIPTVAGLPFSDIRRKEVLAELRKKWTNRLRIGSPLRRYVSPTPANRVNFGRTWLVGAMDSSEKPVTLARTSRVPNKPPFWAFIDSELVWFESLNGPPQEPNQTFNVKRAPVTGDTWGAKVVPHPDGAPVYIIRVQDIDVAARVLIVDDVFAGVGSAALSRRGHFHDGELTAFAVPQQLKRDPANPARQLRCRLWAEHLGIPPDMGLSLLADPISALRYFDRDWYTGSRWQPLTATGSPPLSWKLGVSGSMGFMILQLVVSGSLEAWKPDLWKGIFDPTTSLDLNPNEIGPEV